MLEQNYTKESQLPEKSVINSLEFINFKGLDGLIIDFNAQEKKCNCYFWKKWFRKI